MGCGREEREVNLEDQERGRSRIWQVRTNLDARDMPREKVQRLKYVSAP